MKRGKNHQAADVCFTVVEVFIPERGWVSAVGTKLIPQLRQNLLLASLLARHRGQYTRFGPGGTGGAGGIAVAVVIVFPQLPQNLASSSFSNPHCAHLIVLTDS